MPGTNSSGHQLQLYPWALTEAEPYGYCHGQALDLRPVMLVAQFRVTDEVGTYLCMVRALVFERSVLAYNPTKNEVEWVPTRGLTNDLTWAEKRSTMALANYILCIPQEVAQIMRLGAHQPLHIRGGRRGGMGP